MSTPAAAPPVARLVRWRDRLAPELPRLQALWFAVAVVVIVVVAVHAARHVHFDQLTWWPLPLALIAAVAWWVGLARGWGVLATGHPTTAGISTWCRTQTLRYLPGGIWAPASRTTVIEGSWTDRISTVLAENVISLVAALAIGGLALGLSRSAWWLAVVAVLGVPTLGSRALASRTRLAPQRTRAATANYLVAFAVYAVAASLVQGAISGPHHLLAVAGAATVAWGAGLVVIFAPGGVGVRELVYIGLLSGALPSGQLAAGALTMRIVMVIAELAVLLVAGRPKLDRPALRARLAGVRHSLRPDIGFLRRHAFFGVLLGVGAGLRIIAWLAYRPALFFWDSQAYLQQALHPSPDVLRPLGYPLFLNLLPFRHWLAVIPLVHHVLGLLMAVIIYVLLQRLTVPRWGAALACAPVLLDAFQLDLEQYILSETLFDFLLVCACAVLLWPRRLTAAHATGAGLLLAMVALTRANGQVAIVPAVIAVACLRWERPRVIGARILGAPWRWLRSLRPAALALAALLILFLAPLSAYAVWFHADHGAGSPYALTDWSGRFLYARVAPFADCTKFTVPLVEQHLCPIDPVGHRPRVYGSSVEYYMWGRTNSPVWTLPVSNDQRRLLAGDFAKRVIRAQTWTYVKHVAHDFFRAFYPVPDRQDGELPIFRWQFQTYFPLYFPTEAAYIARFGTPPHVNYGLASFLKHYRRFAFTPGPLLALLLIAGLLASLGVGRSRRSGLRSATFLFTAMAIIVFGSTVLANQFSWRYEIPLIVLTPPAGALALTALLRRPAGATRIQEPEPG